MTRRPRTRAPDPRELVAQGWERQNVACEPHLSEAVALYRELGREVLLVPAAAEEGCCTTCLEADPDRYQVIYTRPAAEPPRTEP